MKFELLMGEDKTWKFLRIFLLLALPFITVYSSLNNNFLRSLDDDWLVVDNPAIQNLNWEGIKYLFFEDHLDCYYHPIAYLSLAIDYHFFGLNSFYFHLHALILHLLSGLLIYSILLRIFKNNYIAFFSAMLFLLHPIQVENYVWASARRQVSYAFYFLLTFRLYLADFNGIKNKKTAYVIKYLLVILLFTIAILAKLSAITFLPVLILFDFYESNSIKVSFSKNWPLKLAIFFVSVTFYLINQEAAKSNFLIATYNFNTLEHVIIFLYSFSFYLVKIFIPIGLSPFYTGPSQLYPLPLVYFFGATATLILGLLSLYSLKTKYRIGGILFGFYCITLAPSANLIWLVSDLPTTLGDRYIYLSSIGIFVLISIGIYKIIKSNIILGYLLTFFGTLIILISSHQQSLLWKDTKTLYAHMRKWSPSAEFMLMEAYDAFETGDTLSAKAILNAYKKDRNGIRINSPFATRLHNAYMSSSLGEIQLRDQFIAEVFEADYDSIPINLLQESMDELRDKVDNRDSLIYSYLMLRQHLEKTYKLKLKKGRL